MHLEHELHVRELPAKVALHAVKILCHAAYVGQVDTVPVELHEARRTR